MDRDLQVKLLKRLLHYVDTKTTAVTERPGATTSAPTRTRSG